MGFTLVDFFAPVLAAGEGYLGVNGLLAVGVGLVVFGAARGIGAIAGNAVESIARQPEAGGRIFTSMIISAALIEGFTFFALVICMLGLAKQ
ncbi:MAG TPA: ATP synthase F0 subunit C [Planctomycetota bacterium]|nr:ATP synthase F0 subunit C [Planctomycetota bacterium]